MNVSPMQLLTKLRIIMRWPFSQILLFSQIFIQLNIVCCINSLQTYVFEAVTTSNAIPEKKNSGGKGLRTWNFQGD